jgi:hypothetical protein
MPGLSQQHSEVACLLTQIRSEYEAAQQGLSGLAQGVSQHRFINRRTERIAELHSQLHSLLGDDAMVLVAAHIDLASEGKRKIEEEKEG